MPISTKPFSLTNSLLFKISIPLLVILLISTFLLGAYLRVSVFNTINSLISKEVRTDVDNLKILLSNRLQQVKRAADTIANDQEILTALAGGRDSLLKMDSRAIDLRNRFDLDVLQIFDQNRISRTNILHANLYRISTLADRISPNQADLFVIEGRLIYLVRSETPTGGIVIVGLDLLTELERLMKQLKLRDQVHLQHPSLPPSTLPTSRNHFQMAFELPVGSSSITVILLRDIETYYQIYEKAQNVVLSGVLFLSLMIFVLSLFIVVTIVQPLGKLSQAAQELTNSDFSQPYQPRNYLNSNHNLLRIGHRDEIGRLVESFARMEQELHHVYSELIRDLERANQEVVEAYEATLQGWANALDLRDHSTERHTNRVAELAQEFAHYLGLSAKEIVALKRGALLHDVGKMVISDKILNKKTPLTDEEWLTIKQHPLYGYVMLRPIEYLQDSLEVIYCHHEKWDGSGYPQGLKGIEIPLKARIFSVIDVFDALITERPYREAWEFEDALRHIRSGAGIDFDPTIVEKFLEWIRANQSKLLEKYYQKA